MVKSERQRHDLVDEPKAGAFGAVSVFLFGVVYILMAFVALYMWSDEDFALSAALATAAIIVPMTVGFFTSELVHQRAGALIFVLVAASLTGALAAWSLAENEDFEKRRDVFSAEESVPELDGEPAP